MTEGKHSFLFWLVLPIILIWLGVGYVIGFVKDKPQWYNSRADKTLGLSIPYFQDYQEVATSGPFITFWFDDAWLSQYLTAYPELKYYGYPAAIAVPIDAIEKTGYMNWAQLTVLQKDGWEITDHGLSHDCQMQTWDREKISNEYRNSKLILWRHRLSADIFVTPCGVDSNIMREEAKKTFIAYRTVDPGLNDLSKLDFYNPKVKNLDSEVKVEDVKGWIDQTKTTNSWLILVFHKVGEDSGSAKGELFNTKRSDFTDILEYVKSSGIQVVVPSQVLLSIIK